ncbi:MAG: hypothetical protein HY862_16630 [Chloroflexi bacterium]|nr:hypothetical protein [Chloroflexota bacterium]
MLKWLSQDIHPITRLNLLILAFFVSLQACALLVVLTSPPTIDSRVAQMLQTLDDSWCLITLIGFLWVGYNAIQLAITNARRFQYTTRRNVVVACLTPLIIVILMLIWRPLLRTTIDYRLDSAFDRSRNDLLATCDRVLEEEVYSDAIQNGVELGAYNRVNILLHDGVVWFDVGDNLRAYGFVCVPVGGKLPEVLQHYEFKKLDDRFYEFSEIENLLTPEARQSQ